MHAGWREGGNPFAGRLRDMTHPQQAALLACINRHMRPNTLAPQCAAAAASSSCVPSLHMGASSRPATPIGFLMESHGCVDGRDWFRYRSFGTCQFFSIVSTQATLRLLGFGMRNVRSRSHVVNLCWIPLKLTARAVRIARVSR